MEEKSYYKLYLEVFIMFKIMEIAAVAVTAVEVAVIWAFGNYAEKAINEKMKDFDYNSIPRREMQDDSKD